MSPTAGVDQKGAPPFLGQPEAMVPFACQTATLESFQEAAMISGTPSKSRSAAAGEEGMWWRAVLKIPDVTGFKSPSIQSVPSGRNTYRYSAPTRISGRESPLRSARQTFEDVASPRVSGQPTSDGGLVLTMSGAERAPSFPPESTAVTA